MNNEMISTVLSQGAFASLFMWLLFYVLKENAKRENKYQDLLEKLTHNYDCITKDVCEIKEILLKKKVNQ
jgi:preprotein translocase subunit YajC